MKIFNTPVAGLTSRLTRCLSLALLMGSVAIAQPYTAAAAQSFKVTSQTDLPDKQPGDGHCDAMPNLGDQCTLRAAIMEANANQDANMIIIPAGTYMLTQKNSGVYDETGKTGDLDVRSLVIIEGQGQGKTIVDGGAIDRVFDIQAPLKTVELRNMTIQNGNSDGYGGGIFYRRGTLKLSSVAVVDNKAKWGGGMYVSEGTMNLSSSLVQNNSSAVTGTSATGGGMLITSLAKANVSDSTIRGNTSTGAGGGITNNGNLVMTRSTVSGNTANAAGGGILNTGALLATNSTISGNQAAIGAGLALTGDEVSSLIHLTVTANEAVRGGGLEIASGTSIGVSSSIIAGNTASENGHDCAGTLESLGNNLLGKVPGCVITGDTTGNQTNVKPKLRALGNYGGTTQTHALLGDSPAVDMAGYDSAYPKDQRFRDRPMDGNADAWNLSDIGAFEYHGPVITSLSPATRTVGGTAFTLTVKGVRFQPNAKVYWNNKERETQYVDNTTLKAKISADDLKLAGTASVRISAPGALAWSGTSSPGMVTIKPVAP